MSDRLQFKVTAISVKAPVRELRIKIKIKLSLCLIWHLNMEVCGGSGVAPRILNL